MPRFKTPDYGLKMIPVDFQRQVLPGSFEFALCHLVDKELNLSALRSRFRNDAGGAPAFDPAVLLKIVLLAYSRGLVSSRAIEAACRHNVPRPRSSSTPKPKPKPKPTAPTRNRNCCFP